MSSLIEGVVLYVIVSLSVFKLRRCEEYVSLIRVLPRGKA